MSLKQGQSPIDERAEFEKWGLTSDGNCNPEDFEKSHDGEYVTPATNRDFVVWQAARKLSALVVPDCLSNPKAGDTYAPNECSHNDNWVAGIDVDSHGHAIECFGLTKEIAEQRRNFVLAMLKGETEQSVSDPIVSDEIESNLTKIFDDACYVFCDSGIEVKQAIDYTIVRVRAMLKGG